MTDIIDFTKVIGISSLCLNMYSASWKPMTMGQYLLEKKYFKSKK